MLVKDILLDNIEPDPNQPRKSLRHLDSLQDSIEEVGQIQPIMVRPKPRVKGKFIIVGGERRWTVFKRLREKYPHVSKWKSIFASINNNPSIYIMLADNLARDNLCLLEKVDGAAFVLEKKFGKDWKKILGRLHNGYDAGIEGKRMQAACRAFGLSPTYLYLSLPVMALSKSTKKKILENLEYFNDGVISKLARLKEDVQFGVVGTIVKERLPSNKSMSLIARTSWGWDSMSEKERWWANFFLRWRKDYKFFVSKIESVLDTDNFPEDKKARFVSNLKFIVSVSSRVLKKLEGEKSGEKEN